jgi:hypothetical protein
LNSGNIKGCILILKVYKSLIIELKNYITHLKSGSESENHNKWLIAFCEKNNMLVGLISNNYLINNDEIGDLEEIVNDEEFGYDCDEKLENIVFKVLKLLLPDKNLTLCMPIHGYSWLGLEKPSFFATFKKMYLDLLLLIRFIFKIKSKKLESHIRSVKFSFHKKAAAEFEKQIKKDDLTLLDINENGHATVNLQNKIELLPKYLESLGFYPFEYDRDWIFVPKEEFKTYKEFSDSVNFPLLNKFMFGSIKGITDREWEELNLCLDKFLIIGFVHHRSFHFVTKQFSKSETMEKLSIIAKQFNLEIAEDQVIS